MERFEKFISVMPDGCWIWIGSVNKKGYGQFKLHGKSERAHRVSYEIYIGKIPTGLHLDHLCNQPSCVNPYHLEPVTPGENTLRSYRKNLKPCKHGIELKSQCSNCKKEYLVDYYQKNRKKLLDKQNAYYKNKVGK